jgi:YVTN family beta-propeller protein
MKKINLTPVFILVVVLLFSCEKTGPGEENSIGYSSGILISNEGAFGNLNGSVSFLDRDSMVMQNNIFHKINGRALGDVVQSISVFRNRAYIVVNNSQKVEVVELETFKTAGVIEGLSYPRYFLGINDDKGYVSNGAFQGLVYVVDLQSLSVTDSITVGNGPEEMLLLDKMVYVANSGGWGNDSTITVIDPQSDKVVDAIEVGHNPVSMCLDDNDRIWVLCKGKLVWGPDYSIAEETNSELIRLNPVTGEKESIIQTGATGDYFWPNRLKKNAEGDQIYFIESAGIYRIGPDDNIQPSDALIQGNFYGFGVDPESGNIYGLTAGDFSSAGLLIRYFPDGAPIDTMQVGIAPNQVVFY